MHQLNACRRFQWIVLAFLASSLAMPFARAIDVGVARIDVTPDEPIRLTGYGGRTTNSTGVTQKLWAKALALGSDRDGPAVFVTLDNCGIAEPTYLEVARRLARKGVRQERLVIACSHTHSGPCTTGWAPNIFSKDIAPAEQAVIDRYTRGLIDKLEQVAVTALRRREPGSLAWTQGSVGFARNRRVVVGDTARFGDNAAGPVDSSLPLLVARSARGQWRAIVANYACHCTTLGGEFNSVCGDWAGYAQEAIERDHPGAIALISIGCGADANPSPRGGADFGLAFAKQHGEALAAEVKRLLGRSLTPLTGRFDAGIEHIQLPFGPAYSRAQWEQRATQTEVVGYHARKWLARFDAGEKLPQTLSYYVQTWHFGDDLGLVFLSGEVVVDYALRLKRELDATRLWVSGYANYVPCYIPSRRILAEGGYEAEDSLWYYDRPGRLSTNIEDQIARTVHQLIPKAFEFDARKAELPDPTPARTALGLFRTSADLQVELVAAEPLIESPVAIDWGADGRLWVCEMYDYPTGLDGKFKPGGRIKVLSCTRGDGHYDRADLFLDGLAFPTGVMPWGRGALIAAAPDILYAEDTDGDGRADVVQTNFTGFATHNFQARVNGFTRGLDGWLYGSSGLFGGRVRSGAHGGETDLSGRDFRFRPDTGEIEPVAGISQMGRVRDEFEQWYGNDNSTLLWHYPLPDHDARRNPQVLYPEPRVLVPRGEDPNRLFPASRTLERFNDPQMANRTTSACGPDIYRDELLGPAFRGNAFICEPVHNLVTRLVLHPDGVSFAGTRAAGEERGEFLASTDNWCRPVQVRTGPDGALWVVDMYRFVIEHPRWIPPDRLRQLDVRAGAERGRIYRVAPRGAKLRPIRNLTRLDDRQLAEAMNTPNGPTRDLVQGELMLRHPGVQAVAGDPRWQKVLGLLATGNPRPEVRVQALATLARTGALQEESQATNLLLRALADAHPAVRRSGLRELEALLERSASAPGTAAATASAKPDRWAGVFRPGLAPLVQNPDAGVRFQLALALGASRDPGWGSMLGQLAITGAEDRWQRAAVLSSAASHAGAILRAMMTIPGRSGAHLELTRQIVGSGAEVGSLTAGALSELLSSTAGDNAVWAFGLMTSWLDALERRGERKISAADRVVLDVAARRARALAGEGQTPPAEAGAAVQFLGREPTSAPGDLALFVSLLQAGTPPPVRQAATAAIQRRRGRDVPLLLLEHWEGRAPAERTAILHLLVSRNEWAAELLQTVEQGKVKPAEIALPDRQVLLALKDSALRDRANRLFAAGTSTNRAELLARYQEVAGLAGVPDRGAVVFDKNCAQCHALRGRGFGVGPNLVEFAGKAVPDFLLAVLDPNAAINPNYLAYTLELKDGRSLTGLVRGETAGGLTLAQGGGVQERILRADIQEIRASTLSLMPEGLEQGIGPQDMADLIAWIKKSAPGPFGGATAEQAARALREFQQTNPAKPAGIVTSVERLPYPSWLGRWPLAYCRQDGSTLSWRAEPGPQPEGGGPYRFRLAAALGFLSQPHGSFSLKVNGRPAFDFDVTLGDGSWRSEDGRVRMDYAVMESNAEDSNGVLTLELDPGWVKEGQPVQFTVTGTASGSQRWFGVYVLPDATSAAARP
jgi:putative membrane-bound dehydrogenase-like protein